MNLDTTTLDKMTPLLISVAGQWSPAPDMRTPLNLVDGQWVPRPAPAGAYNWNPQIPIITVDGQELPAPCLEWHGWATAPEPFVAITFHRSSSVCRWAKSKRFAARKQVMFSLLHSTVRSSIDFGHAQTCSEPPSYNYRPVVQGQQTFTTGVIQPFTHVDGNPAIDVLFLFLSQRDIRLTRSGSWRLRPELLETIVDTSLRKMLTMRRTGYLNLESSS